MPFDGLTDIKSKFDSVTDLLTELGIKPVSMAILEQHRAREIAKHKASPFPELYLLMRLISGMFTTAFLIIGIMSWSEYSNGNASALVSISISLMAVLGFTMMCYTIVAKVKGPARWIEKLHYTDWGLHAPQAIEKLARKVVTRDPTASLIVGTLYQEEIVLDPYLLVRHQNCVTGMFSYACLGIWDGKKIIHLAQS
jgi:ABC-type transport system involved in multi-copper enzyme maturation permease subunit